ncbi:MAG TPA: hypothetical protein DDW24_14105 [Blastocatellia bacterium]|nr:hypothetical protein [Blastocatellia bacterium]
MVCSKPIKETEKYMADPREPNTIDEPDVEAYREPNTKEAPESSNLREPNTGISLEPNPDDE